MENFPTNVLCQFDNSYFGYNLLNLEKITAIINKQMISKSKTK